MKRRVVKPPPPPKGGTNAEIKAKYVTKIKVVMNL